MDRATEEVKLGSPGGGQVDAGVWVGGFRDGGSQCVSAWRGEDDTALSGQRS